MAPRRVDSIRGRAPLRAMRWPIAIAVGALTTVGWAQSDLPPKVQADILRQQIVEATRDHQPQNVLPAAERYRALQSKGIQIPPGVFYLEAIAADELGDPLRAYDALTYYLKVASSMDLYYRDALHLYPQHAADPAVRARMESQAALLSQQPAAPKHKAPAAQ